MSDYRPHKWVMVKLTNNDNQSYYRVFASWYGGYTGSDSWKLNSGVTKVTEDDHAYHFEGSSGSIYHCGKSTYGTSGYGHGVLTNMIEESKDIVTIEILPEETNFMKLPYE